MDSDAQDAAGREKNPAGQTRGDTRAYREDRK